MKTLSSFIAIYEHFLLENKLNFHRDQYRKSPVVPTHDPMAMQSISNGTMTVHPDEETPERPHVASVINRALGGTEEKPHPNLPWAVNRYSKTKTVRDESGQKQKVSDGAFKLEDMEHVARSVKQFNHPEIQKHLKKDEKAGGEFSADIGRYGDHHALDAAVRHIKKKYSVDMSEPEGEKPKTKSVMSDDEVEKARPMIYHNKESGLRVFSWGEGPDAFAVHKRLHGGGVYGNHSDHPDAVGTNWCTAAHIENYNHYRTAPLFTIHDKHGIHQFAASNGEVQKPENDEYSEEGRNQMFDDLIRRHPDLPHIEELQGLHEKFPLGDQKRNRIVSALDSGDTKSLSNSDYFVAAKHDLLKPEHVRRIVDDPDNADGHNALIQSGQSLSNEDMEKISSYPGSIGAHHKIAMTLSRAYGKPNQTVIDNIFSHPNSVGAQGELLLNGHGTQENIDRLFSNKKPNQAHIMAFLKGKTSDNVTGHHIKFASDNFDKMDDYEKENFAEYFRHINHPLFTNENVFDQDRFERNVNKDGETMHKVLDSKNFSILRFHRCLRQDGSNIGNEHIHKLIDMHGDHLSENDITNITSLATRGMTTRHDEGLLNKIISHPRFFQNNYAQQLIARRSNLANGLGDRILDETYPSNEAVKDVKQNITASEALVKKAENIGTMREKVWRRDDPTELLSQEDLHPAVMASIVKREGQVRFKIKDDTVDKILAHKNCNSSVLMELNQHELSENSIEKIIDHPTCDSRTLGELSGKVGMRGRQKIIDHPECDSSALEGLARNLQYHGGRNADPSWKNQFVNSIIDHPKCNSRAISYLCDNSHFLHSDSAKKLIDSPHMSEYSLGRISDLIPHDDPDTVDKFLASKHLTEYALKRFALRANSDTIGKALNHRLMDKKMLGDVFTLNGNPEARKAVLADRRMDDDTLSKAIAIPEVSEENVGEILNHSQAKEKTLNTLLQYHRNCLNTDNFNALLSHPHCTEDTAVRASRLYIQNGMPGTEPFCTVASSHPKAPDGVLRMVAHQPEATIDDLKRVERHPNASPTTSNIALNNKMLAKLKLGKRGD